MLEIAKEFLPAIYGSSFLLAAIGLWVLFQAIRPLFQVLQDFFNDLFKGNAAKVDEGINTWLGSLSDTLRRQAISSTEKVITWSDNFYLFRQLSLEVTKGVEKHWLLRVFVYWSPGILVMSWLIGFVYLSGALLVFGIGHGKLFEPLFWQLLFLLGYYLLLATFMQRLLRERRLGKSTSAERVVGILVLALAFALSWVGS